MVKPCGDVIDDRQERGGRRAVATKPVLRIVEGKVPLEEREEKSLEDFRSRAKETDWTVTRALRGRLARFEHRQDNRSFPDCGEISLRQGQVKQRGEVVQSDPPHVFKMERT